MPREELEIPLRLERLSVLTEEGRADDLMLDLDEELLKRLYRTMLFSRRFDERRLRLQRQGRIGTFAPAIGQEAAQLGAISTLGEDDWFVPSYRDTAAALLAHEAMHEGRVAAESIAGRPAAFDPRAVPAVVYTDPQVGWCGLTSEAAAEEGRDVEVTRCPWRASGRAVTMGGADGFTKLLTDPDSGRLLGVGIVGRDAESLIAEAVLAVEMGAVAEDLALSIAPHPTLSETLHEAADLLLGQPVHLPPPR